MGLYDGNNMRGMMKADYSDIRMDKSRELNPTMSIDTTKSEDVLGRQVHSLNKQNYTNDNGQQ